jgi:hypothetical protein
MDTGAVVSIIDPVSSSGSQNTCASVDLRAGAIGKSQPPPFTHAFDRRWCLEEFSVIALIILVPTQPFPTDIGGSELVDVIVT